jgi:hypothetical protein
VDITLPIRTQNPLNLQTGNSRVAAIIRTKKRAKERAVTYMALAGRTPKARDLPYAKYIVTLSRMSFKKMDDEGFIASAKGIRDAVADALGLDDGDTKRIEFKYDPHMKCPKGSYGVRIQIDAVNGKESNMIVEAGERESDKSESQEAPQDPPTPAADKETNGQAAQAPKAPIARGPRKAHPRAPAPSSDAEPEDKVSYVQTVRDRRKELVREIGEQIEAKKTARALLDKQIAALEEDITALEQERSSMTGGDRLQASGALGARAARHIRSGAEHVAKAHRPDPGTSMEPPRLKRRTTQEILGALGKVVALVARRPKAGMRSEQIQAALRLDAREMPMILKTGLELGKLKANGERRSTTYTTR